MVELEENVGRFFSKANEVWNNDNKKRKEKKKR